MVSQGHIKSAYVFGNRNQQKRIEAFGDPAFVERFMRERADAARREREQTKAVEKSELLAIRKTRRKMARKHGANKEAAALFETFDSALAKWHARNFTAKFPRFEIADVLQEVYAAIYSAALDYDLAKRKVSDNFPAFATQRVAWRLSHYGRHGRKLELPPQEIHLDDPVGEDSTLADVIASDAASSESSDCDEAVLCELREAIARPGVLTNQERKVCRLHYIDGLERREVARRLGLTFDQAVYQITTALEKLRGELVPA